MVQILAGIIASPIHQLVCFLNVNADYWPYISAGFAKTKLLLAFLVLPIPCDIDASSFEEW